MLALPLSAGLVPKKGSKPLVYGGVISRLGNQCFQVAAALSLGIDNNATVCFPDFREKAGDDIEYNGKHVFYRLNFDRPGPVREVFGENGDGLFRPITYKPGMMLVGYFQSEKYFARNWDKIRPYFLPSDGVLSALGNKYGTILDHPLTVAIHVRHYEKENPALNIIFEILGHDYYDRAIELFPDDALFVIFSDDIGYARTLFADLDRPHIFVEGNHYIHDFYLMSLMKHQIISNSTFSWWGAYLNDNPYKIVIGPRKWYKPAYHAKSDDIIPSNWISL